jgi:hypothetical protein
MLGLPSFNFSPAIADVPTVQLEGWSVSNATPALKRFCRFPQDGRGLFHSDGIVVTEELPSATKDRVRPAPIERAGFWNDHFSSQL